MLKKLVSGRTLALYFLFIMITWLEAIINPTLLKLIVESFETTNINLLSSLYQDRPYHRHDHQRGMHVAMTDLLL